MKTEAQQSKDIFDFAKYIKQTSAINEYSCNICYQIGDNIMICATCKKMFCLSCLHSICINKYQCPFRCSDNFVIRKLTQIPILYVCPALNCQSQYSQISHFLTHVESCPKNSQEFRNILINRKQYKCIEGKHNLQFLVGAFNQLNADFQCDICQNSKLCRSICRKCNQRFCVKCRPVPCSKKGCPYGHKFEIYQAVTKFYICDVCSAPAFIAGNSVYDDKQCNFGVCLRCWDHLPQDNPTVKAQLLDFQYCNESHNIPIPQQKQKHRLCFVGKNLIKDCKICEKTKQCYLKCKQCQTYYCLGCKVFLAKDKQICMFNHEIKKQLIDEDDPLNSQNQKQERICDKCKGLLKSEFYVDEGCGVRICQKCITYLRRMENERERNIYSNFCVKGHNLSLYLNSFLVMNCAQCKDKKCIKFACTICTTNRFYCGGCKLLIKNKIDCLSHTPILIQSQAELDNVCKQSQTEEGYICHKCNNVSKQEHTYYCGKCSYVVCENCFNQ